MAYENSSKVVRVTFGFGGRMDHFIRPDDPDSIGRLIVFLRESNGVIVGLDGLTDEETQRLRNAEIGRPLFAPESQDG